MTTTAKAIINSKHASNVTSSEYTVPSSTRTIIDKFTATNTDGSSRTVSVYFVPSGSMPTAANLVIKDHSISAGATYDMTELKSHVLETGDMIWVVASLSDRVVVRCSGREVA